MENNLKEGCLAGAVWRVGAAHVRVRRPHARLHGHGHGTGPYSEDKPRVR